MEQTHDLLVTKSDGWFSSILSI